MCLFVAGILIFSNNRLFYLIIYITKLRMLPNQLLQFPQLYLMPSYQQRYNPNLPLNSPFFCQNHYPFYEHSIQTNSTFPFENITLEAPFSLGQAIPPQDNRGITENRSTATTLENECRSRLNLPKEKAIRKVINRPTSYLTERKFYLTQPSIAEEAPRRTLRPRNKKNKKGTQPTSSTLNEATIQVKAETCQASILLKIEHTDLSYNFSESSCSDKP